MFESVSSSVVSGAVSATCVRREPRMGAVFSEAMECVCVSRKGRRKVGHVRQAGNWMWECVHNL